VGAAPRLIRCAQMTHFGVNFRSDKDEYVTGWFSSDRRDLDCDNVQARVGEFDSRPVFVGKDGDVWQTNFKLPPGLEPGWQEVRIRAGESPWSEGFSIALDLPIHVHRLAIEGACDGKTWKPFEIALQDSAILTLWVGGVPENAGYGEISVLVGEHLLAADYVSPWEHSKASQINVSVPADVGAGVHPVTVAIAGVKSEPVLITCG